LTFVSLSQTHFSTVNPTAVRSDRVFPASSFPDPLVANSLIPGVLP
jgi:hypothetical protein